MHITIFLALQNAVQTRYSLYYSDIRQNSYLTFGCLYIQFVEGELNAYSSYIMNHQLTPYCRRPDNDEKQDEISDMLHENIANKVTFTELRKKGVTSEQLLNWGASIDVA
ncbi:unnamed protein product [Rotaria sordida]|uniref:Uncharacterized protein n=1 Tax=Rotaria sordida TaxID=392033 RepID=A0A820NL79_9BILA|nr:unnamed protein product [Rotaria sordida]